jgi:excinuclease UvrABC nuclease subunit
MTGCIEQAKIVFNNQQALQKIMAKMIDKDRSGGEKMLFLPIKGGNIADVTVLSEAGEVLGSRAFFVSYVGSGHPVKETEQFFDKNEIQVGIWFRGIVIVESESEQAVKDKNWHRIKIEVSENDIPEATINTIKSGLAHFLWCLVD